MKTLKMSLFSSCSLTCLSLCISLLLPLCPRLYAKPYSLYKKVNKTSILQQLHPNDLPTIASLTNRYEALKERCRSHHDQYGNQRRRRKAKSNSAISKSKLKRYQFQWNVAITHLKLSTSGGQLTRYYHALGQAKHINTLPQWSLNLDRKLNIKLLLKVDLTNIELNTFQSSNPQKADLLGLEWSHILPPSLQSTAGALRKIQLSHHLYDSQCVIVDIPVAFLESKLGLSSELATVGRSPSLIPNAKGDLEAQAFHLTSEGVTEPQSYVIWKLSDYKTISK